MAHFPGARNNDAPFHNETFFFRIARDLSARVAVCMRTLACPSFFLVEPLAIIAPREAAANAEFRAYIRQQSQVGRMCTLAEARSILGATISEDRLSLAIAQLASQGFIVLVLKQKNWFHVFITHNDILAAHSLFGGWSLVEYVHAIDEVLFGSRFYTPQGKKRTAGGRRRITDISPLVMPTLVQYFSRDSEADPRLKDVVYGGGATKSLKQAAFAVERLTGLRPAHSTILSYLRPVRSSSFQSQRHKSSPLETLRFRMPSKDGACHFRLDSRYANSQNACLLGIFGLLAAEGKTLIVSRDDKAKVLLQGSCVVRQSRVWGGEEVSLPVHDFHRSSKFSVTPSGLLNVELLSGTRGGHASYVLKFTESQPSSALHFLDLFLFQLESGCLRAPPNGWPVHNLLILVDGGSDETMASLQNRFLYSMLFHLLGAEMLVVAKWEPNGGSKKNPVERIHAVANRVLGGGELLPANLRESVPFLDSDPNKVDPKTRHALAKVGMTEMQRRMKNATFSKHPFACLVWPLADSSMMYFDKEAMESALEQLRTRKHKIDKESALGITQVPGNAKLLSLLERCKGRSRFPTVGEVATFVQDTNHCVLNKHLFILAKCGDEGCCGQYDRAPLAAELLGTRNRGENLRAIVEPVLERDNSRAYVSKATRLAASYSAAMVRTRDLPEPCPSLIVAKAVVKCLAKGEEPTLLEIQLLGAECGYHHRDKEFNSFVSFFQRILREAKLKKQMSRREIH